METNRKWKNNAFTAVLYKNKFKYSYPLANLIVTFSSLLTTQFFRTFQTLVFFSILLIIIKRQRKWAKMTFVSYYLIAADGGVGLTFTDSCSIAAYEREVLYKSLKVPSLIYRMLLPKFLSKVEQGKFHIKGLCTKPNTPRGINSN